MGSIRGSGYRIQYTIDFPQPIGYETFTGDLATGDYVNLIAPARTFGFKEDEAMLRDMGLIRGASTECAIILSRQGVENGPLRFEDEFVRHKVLDLIGDLALAGRQDSGPGGGGEGGACDAYCSCATTYAGPVGVGAGAWVR